MRIFDLLAKLALIRTNFNACSALKGIFEQIVSIGVKNKEKLPSSHPETAKKKRIQNFDGYTN